MIPPMLGAPRRRHGDVQAIRDGAVGKRRVGPPTGSLRAAPWGLSVSDRLPQVIRELLHGTDVRFVLADSTTTATCTIRLYTDVIELYQLHRDQPNIPRAVMLDCEGLRLETANGMGLTYREDHDHWALIWTLGNAVFEGIEAFCTLERLYSRIVSVDKSRGQRGPSKDDAFEFLMTAANCLSVKAGLTDISEVPNVPAKDHRDAAMEKYRDIADLYAGDDGAFKKRMQRNAADTGRLRKTRLAFRSLAHGDGQSLRRQKK